MNRPLRHLLLAAALPALCLGLVRGAAAELSVAAVSGLRGTTVLAPITYTGEGGAVTALQFEILYDANTVGAQDATAGPVLAAHLIASGEPTPGDRDVVVYSTRAAVLPDGVIGFLPLVIPSAAAPQTIPLVITNALLADPAAELVTPVQYNAGSLTIETALPPRLNALVRGSDGSVQFTVTGAPGLYYIDASADLHQWTTLSTNQISAGSAIFIDRTAGSATHRYYRGRAAQ